MTSGLHEYERWLTERIDPYMCIQGSYVVLDFGRTRGIDISACTDLDTLVPAAAQLRDYLETHKPTAAFPSLPERYLLLRFCGMVIRHNRLKIDSSDAEHFIDRAWGGFDWQTGRWRG